MTTTGRKNWQVQAEHSGSLIRLQNLIQRGSGSCLLILQQNRPSYRDGLIEFLGQEHSRVLNLKEPGGFEAFEAELEKGEQGRILHLINLESLGEEKQRAFFKGLNYHREHIARTCAGILAFWLPEPLVREMALQAADFWAWREQVLDFTVPVEPVERIAFDWLKNSNMEVAGKQERIREIEEFLARPVELSSLSTADLKRELGNLYKSIGEYAKAEQIFTEAIAEYRELDEIEAQAVTQRDLADIMSAQDNPDTALCILKEKVLPVFRQLHNEREEAETKDRIADLFQQRSELDQALNIRHQEILPILERLGDVRNKAVTMGKIADILKARGELDKALDIRRNEELPVYEKIGDVRAKAVTMGDIADILQARGELDKALDIRRNEELPVYERLGDVRSKAVTMGRIADILQARGELDKALEIRQQEELPVYEQLGDVREKAVTMGKIADIFQARGELDKALEIYQKEELPVYEKLGDVFSLLLCRTDIARLLHEIDAKTNKEEIEHLLRLALADAQRLKLPGETEWIEEIIKKLGIAAKKDGAE
ncbi:tetratricopeptide repeat protein [Candidatus Electrothrix sp.]|uniref:tetratricopeptide repeat protein n=1 Tax=Candidatus Electrothrix sp. TaxID=2170559 RepID=UPI0040578398